MLQMLSALLNIPEAAELAQAVERGGCPAAVTGLANVHRAQLAAALSLRAKRPLVMICSDESEANRLADVLYRYCAGMPLHVNLIPVNSVEERGFLPSEKSGIEAFVRTLEGRHIVATVRRTLGSDIDASCGQLRSGDK